MKTKMILLSVMAILSTHTPAQACGVTPELLARQAVSTNVLVASNAILQLRKLGSEGLNALLKAHDTGTAPLNKDAPQWQRLRAALDAVGGQRDCHASRLFWHKDIEAAKSEAQRTGKPILSLRLLGNLDEEFSCANSRFFRTTLYANKEVSDYLRDHFVLHWKSVRPVPRITIDMGDGRKIERTITGNSIHYVLDANGEVIDAMPGLYGPRAFLTGLKNAEEIAKQTAHLAPGQRGKLLENFHTARLENINQRWADDITSAKAGMATPHALTLANGAVSYQMVARATPAQPTAQQSLQGPQSFPTAMAATFIAPTKMVAEVSMLRSLGPRRAALERSTDDVLWAQIAILHKDDSILDANSTALIQAKTLNAKDAMRLALSKARVEDPMLKTVQNLQRSIAEDTVRNEYTFHAKIHEWLATAGTPREVEALNRRVYAELFLTPDSDPWLGLVPADTFSALENGGLVQSSKLQAPSSR